MEGAKRDVKKDNSGKTRGGRETNRKRKRWKKVMVWGIKSGRAVLISVAGCAAPVVRK